MKWRNMLALWVGCLGTTACEKTVTIWHTESDPATQKAIEATGGRVLARVGRKYGRVRFRVEYVQWDQLGSRLTQALRSRQRETELPLVSHLEPFMAYSLYREFPDALTDIGDVVETLEARHGPILRAVKSLQRFDEHYFGIAQHTGVSFILYRADILKKNGIATPRTWNEFFSANEKLVKAGVQHPIVVPGASPFFMEALLSEYLSSVGGALLRDSAGTRIANYDSPAAKQALGVFARMKPFLHPEYTRLSYPAQFKVLAQGGAVFMMFAGARAYKTFEADSSADATRFASLEPPRFDNAGHDSFTSLDAEPWVVFRHQDAALEALGKEWIREFYETPGYEQVLRTVPIQLMPIFERQMKTYAAGDVDRKWTPWFELARTMIAGDRAVPYFMQRDLPPDASELLRMANASVSYDLIMRVLAAGQVRDEDLRTARKDLTDVLRANGR